MTELAKITTPEGVVSFVAHTKAISSKYNSTLRFSARIEIDGTTTEGKALLKTIKAINENLGSTKGVSKEGNFFVNATSTTAPVVMNAEGQILRGLEIPAVETSNGKTTARLRIKPFASKVDGMGGGLGLEGIQFIKIEEYQGTVIDEDEVAAALQQASIPF